ncbi:hypothetical protein BC831DRAFT_397473 [Entophlyctis helioformis]|nr:hypothetical protein BC831DRAFT_397473 [Entophlyctis helioformis]
MDYGLNCSVADCGRYDFLPFVCGDCRCAFCPEHRFGDKHRCPGSSTDASLLVCPKCSLVVSSKPGSGTDSASDSDRLKMHMAAECSAKVPSTSPGKIPCSAQGCTTAELWSALCPDCGLRFCLAHRYAASHKCAALAQASIDKMDRKAAIKTFVSDKLGAHASAPASSAATTAAKQPKPMSPAVALMKLKMNAKGDAKIPSDLRVFLSIIVAADAPQGQHRTLGVFHRKTISIGKLVDALAETAQVANTNNVAGTGPKLSLFHGATGMRLGTLATLGDLLGSGAIAQGQTLILDRSDSDHVQPCT